MIPLAGPAFPRSNQELGEAVAAGFNRHHLAAREVLVEGGTFPAVETLRIDLSGAEATRELRGAARGPATGGQQVIAARLEVLAEPLLFEGTPLRLRLTAEQADFSAVEVDGADEHVLHLQRAANGQVELRAQLTDLEAAIRRNAAELAGKHGVEIQNVRLELSSRGPREIAFRAEVVAKMIFVKAPVTITGEVRLDDDLNLWISNLDLAGGGMVAGMAGSFIRPQFDKIQNRPFPLAVLALGEVRLRDVEIETGETIRLSARFGS